jgi:hypothetical protein
MKFGGRCENVHFKIGDYSFKSHMFSIEMGVVTLLWEMNGYTL